VWFTAQTISLSKSIPEIAADLILSRSMRNQRVGRLQGLGGVVQREHPPLDVPQIGVII